MFSNLTRRVALALAAATLAVPASALTLEITFTNNQSAGGVSFTPLWGAFHDGSFDSFDAGMAANLGVETIAEVGNPGNINTILGATDPNAASIFLAQPVNGPPPVDPGETASTFIDVDSADGRFFSFLTMLIPSNDTFAGNDMALELFDGSGTFLGDQIIDLGYDDFYDAGTEVNDATDGPAFVVGQDGAAGTDENGVITRIQDLSEFASETTPLGGLNLAQLQALSTPGSSGFATISISAVQPAAVPLPATASLGLGALTVLGAVRVMRRKRS